MRKFISILLTLCVILGLCACGGNGKGGANEKAEGLQVGFGRKPIMPDTTGVLLGGMESDKRYSTGYLDELSVTCIAISEGEETILLYTCDLIVVSQEVYDAKESITEATGISGDNIILNATHTHSGVSIRTKWNGVDQYKVKFKQAAADAAVEALADRSAAEMCYGSTETDLVYVRHYLCENGTTYGNRHGSLTNTSLKEHLYDADDELQVIKFTRAAEDKKDVVLMNLGAHSTIVSSTQTTLLSADWPGVARSYVEANSDSLCAVFEAAAGDQIPFSKIIGLCPVGNKTPDYGNAIGAFCVGVLDGEMTKAEGTGFDLVQRVHEIYSMELHAMTIHGVSFIFAPYEMFGASGRQIKDSSPYDMTFVITCSENSIGYHRGYIPTPIAFEGDELFYEAQVTKYPMGTAEALVKTYIDILTEMKNAG